MVRGGAEAQRVGEYLARLFEAVGPADRREPLKAYLAGLLLGPGRIPGSAERTIIELPGKEAPMTPNIADIFRHHVSLEVRCVDRLYLHASLPKLQTSGGLCYFLRDHLGHPVDALDRLQRPSVDRRQRVSARRFGDPRVMALCQALCHFTHLPRSFRRDLRPLDQLDAAIRQLHDEAALAA